MALTIASDTVLAVAPKDRAGAASAVSETGYELGTALGIALLGSVLTAVYQGALRIPDGLPPDVAAVLIVGAGLTWRLLPGRREAVNEMAAH